MTDQAPELLPPFEIYDRGVEIGDANGHLCTAENPALAQAILAALRATRPAPAERPVPQVRAQTIEECIATFEASFTAHGSVNTAIEAMRDLYALSPDEPARVSGLTIEHRLQAVRATAIEECELAARGPVYKEIYNGGEGHNWSRDSGYGKGRHDAADAIRALAPARVTPSTVGGEALELAARTAEKQARQWVNGESSTTIGQSYQRGCSDAAKAIRALALSPTIASEKEPVQASIDQRGPDVPGLGRDYR